MKNLFKALDGGHLDQSLFSSHVDKTTEKEGKNHEKTRVSSRLRFGLRVARRSDDETSRRSPRSDSGV